MHNLVCHAAPQKVEEISREIRLSPFLFYSVEIEFVECIPVPLCVCVCMYVCFRRTCTVHVCVYMYVCMHMRMYALYVTSTNNQKHTHTHTPKKTNGATAQQHLHTYACTYIHTYTTLKSQVGTQHLSNSTHKHDVHPYIHITHVHTHIHTYM